MTTKKKKRTTASDPEDPVQVVRKPHAIYFDSPGKTRQSFKDECDVNRIVDRFTRTGIVEHGQRRQPQYGDAPDQDFFTAACIQAEVRSQEEERNLNPDPESQETASEAPEAPEASLETQEDTSDDQAPQDAAQDESSG